MMLYWFHETKGNKTRLTWPAVDGGKVDPDRRRSRRLRAKVEKGFGHDLLSDPGLADEAPTHPGTRFQIPTSYECTASADERLPIYELAKWGVSPLEYGTPTREARESIEDCALPMARSLIDAGPPARITELLQHELDTCRKTGDLAALAAWLELLTRGAMLLHHGTRAFQQNALSELESLASAGGGLPAAIKRALTEGHALRELMYYPLADFGNESWTWTLNPDGRLEMHVPALVPYARYQFGPVWLDRLLLAFAQSDAQAIKECLRRFGGLTAAMAHWRITQPGRTDPRREHGHVPYDVAEESPITCKALSVDQTPAAADEDDHHDPSNLAKSLLATRPREWEVFRRIVIDGEPATEVAASMGLTEGRISQLKKQAVERLRSDPRLRALWER